MDDGGGERGGGCSVQSKGVTLVQGGEQEGNGPLDQRATMVSNCCMEGDLVEEGELWGKVFRN